MCLLRYVGDYARQSYLSSPICYDKGMPNRHDGSSLHLLFRALADPLRLRLLNLIADREICVCYLVEILRTSQPKISRHLAYLRRAGVVGARREGKWMHYKLIVPKDNAAAGTLRDVLRRLREMPAMRRDVSRLTSACCAPQKFEVPASAPQPQELAVLRT